jgi:hypothetical protein
MQQSSRNTENESKTSRRDFGKGALWVAPTLTVLLAASAQPAAALSTTSGDGYTPIDPS